MTRPFDRLRAMPGGVWGQLALVAGGVLIPIVLLLVVVHTPPVRRAILRYVIAEVERRYAIRIEASRLDYNLAALTVGLADVRLAAQRTADRPFFDATYLRATLSARALGGAPAFKELAVVDGRIRIGRDRDGRMNLPESSETPAGEPAPLDIAHISVPRLTIEIADAQNELALAIPALSLDIGRDLGRVVLNATATVTLRDRQTHLSTLDGGASFDGRALRLKSVALRSDEATLQLDGVLSVIAKDPGVDLEITGTADAARLARWAIDQGELPRGVIALNLRASGPFAGPTVDVRVRSDRLEWQRIDATDVVLESRVTADAADIRRAQLTVVGGHVDANGRIPFGGEDAHVSASWTGVDATQLTNVLAGPLAVRPTGTLSGALTLAGPLREMAQWSADVTLRAEGGGTSRGRLAIPGEARLQLSDGHWHIEARHRLGSTLPLSIVAGGAVAEPVVNSTLAGRVEIVDFTNIPPLVRMLRLLGVVNVDPALVSAGILSGRVALGGRLAAPSIDAEINALDLAGPEFSVRELRATAAGDAIRPRLTFTADAPSVVVAREEIIDVRLGGQLDGDRLTLGALSASQPANSGRLRLTGTYELQTGQYDARADVAQWTFTPAPDRPLAAQLDVVFIGAGSLDEPRGRGSIRASGVAWNGTSPGDLVADVQLDGEAANITARAPDLNATLKARIAARAPYQTSADLEGDTIDLQKLIPPSASPTPLTGHVSFAAHADGPLAEWRTGTARLDLTALDAMAGDLPVTLAEAGHLRFAAERVFVDRLEVNAGATHLSASGELPLAEGSGTLSVSADGDIGEAARAVAAAGLADVPITEGSGPLAARAAITGSLEKPVIVADVEAGPGSVAIRDFSIATDLRVRAHLERDVIDLREAHAAYEGAVLNASGSIPLAVVGAAPAPATLVPASLHATVSGITPAVLRGVLDPTTIDDLAGTIDLAVNIETPSTTDLGRAMGDVTLTRLDLELGGLPVTQRVPTRILLSNGFARIESWNWTGTGATLGVFGQVRLADRQAAIIANGDIDLRVLTPFVRGAGMSTGGHLVPRLSITGPLDAPRVDGDVALEGGEVRLIDPRIIVNGLTAQAAVTRTDFTLRTLNGSINGGTLTGTGTIAYQPDAGLNAHLTTDIRDMALDFPVGLRSQLDAMLQLDVASAPGAAAPSGELSGTVTVLRGAYREPLAVVGGLLTALRARGVAATGAGAPDQSALLEQLALDIRVLTDEDLVVDNNYARAQLAADVNVIGTAAAPALSGRAVLREDGQLFVGRNVYTISPDTPSTIDFVSPTTIEPEFNIHLTTRVAGRTIAVALTGAAESPQVNMSSDDGLGQADITALLLTGRTLDQLGTADASFIGTQVVGNFSGEVLGFAGRAVGLDTLRLGGVEDTGTRLDPNAVATEVDPTSRLTFGKSLGPTVDVTFSQSLRDSTAQTWIVEYLPARQLDIRFVNDDADLRSYAFRHDVSFGRGTAAAAARRSTGSREEQRIGDVTIEGPLAFPEPRIRGLLALEPRDTFDFARWQDDRDRLEDFYQQNGHLAARVTASRAVSGAVVNLTYVIDAGPATRIDVTGIDGDRQVQQQLADAWAASILDELLVDEATQIVRAALLRRGYVRPVIMARLTEEDQTQTLHVDVRPGDRSTHARVRVAAADSPGAAAVVGDLEARIAERGLEREVLTNPEAVTADLTAYLRSRGYLRASVKAASPLFENDAAVLPVTVDPGPQFVLASIAFEGRQNVPEDDIAPAIDVTLGSPYNPAAIDDSRGRIVAVYRGRGFAAARVTANAAARATEPVVDLTFEIAEGSRQTIGDVVVSGNGGIDEDVVTRALRLTVGATLEPTELLRARTRIFDTGLFRRVDVTTEAMPRVSATDPVQPMRIRVALEAWPALRLRYGFQASEEFSATNPTARTVAPGLSADLTRRTLFGRAISLGGSLQYQRRENSARALLNTPTLLTFPIQSSLVLERVHHTLEGTSSVSNRHGVSWEQRMQTARHLTLSYSYRFDRDHTFSTRIDPILGTRFDLTVNVARLIGNAAWDTRDDPLNSRRGSLFSSSVQWAPDRLGSEFRFIKYVGQAYRFQNVNGIVLASAARLGLVTPLGGQDLISSERFFAGGSRTVRGIDENSLGPRDFFGDPAGGEAMVVLNQEARIPLYKWVSGVAFIDAGNVFRTISELKFGDLTGSVGVGIRLNTPFALLRADYGKVAWGPAPRTGRWFFGIGQAF